MEPIRRSKEFYRQVRAVLSDESKWVQGTLAKDSQGRACLTDSPDACCWCLIGACLKAAGPLVLPLGTLGYTWQELFPEVCAITPVPDQLNDNGTYEDVMGVLDLAIERAEA